jgi:hypothetical protein
LREKQSRLVALLQGKDLTVVGGIGVGIENAGRKLD